ncbi:MAG: hypothetical protein UX80_C0005G0055 [Candidatus Amesbacteria bacterium GW2011_GWA2_47_11b]|uniref:Membrane protein 6-pyruvoyl-tetrahydropterin synthase-related domain-containing protein n=2 Tax=Candidatus Amesiibacteriota TaxID=1752730 RepID=A0A0G1SLC0_9BACT|nr:MAG: hypothetical protein UX80_C0005G0055 [Candidatus Amesbacteria bacterium GW2011_GWA2_47_11b]KKU70289.1 MAG: hypothetical protein UX92_C0002G0033 [Candidatus Amesbacteria bacterium GW2011_GWA1_47_20]
MKKDLVLLLLLILPAFAPLVQRGYFSMHDDMQSIRQQKMDQCLVDLQFPCRWSLDLGYGYGYPLFNYYPPLPYLIGQPFRWLGFQYIDVVKSVGVLGFITAAASMYFLGREFWGRLGGLVAAAFYTYAPYHSVDFYVRGAMNEFWALALFPAIFYFSYKLIHDGAKYIPLVAISVAGLMLSHNPILMIFAPVLVIWCLFWTFKFRSISSIRSIRNLFFSALWALGLAAFFTLPVLFETKFVSVWTLTAGYFNYLAHFLDLNQIFLRINWGYGESVYGRGDTMSFALGYLHWIIPAIILVLLPFTKNLKKHFSLVLFFALGTLSFLFMSHFKATPIWKAFPPLEFLQFPWRFLTISIFAASFLSGAIALIISKRTLIILVCLVILINSNYFHPRQWYPDMTDTKKFSGKSWQLLITSGIFDYLPIWAPQPPADPALEDIKFVAGDGIYSTLVKKSNRQEYLITTWTPTAVAELQTYYFPGWKIWVDGKEVTIDPSRDKILGRMQVDLSPGKHTVTARLTNTPIRTIGNILSTISWSLLLFLGFRGRRHRSITL